MLLSESSEPSASTVESAENQTVPVVAGHLGTPASRPHTGTVLQRFGALGSTARCLAAAVPSDDCLRKDSGPAGDIMKWLHEPEIRYDYKEPSSKGFKEYQY
ncbi:hypothetical protein L1987_85148 [Smallanthus sonchifolius]|uniref:Uncharacterized protein n=3 Tax=Smallanthus sonchifolius TaxID=185202 RepID=A0ACB8XWH8_9ASTR|nr:hypothetical protein L1987_85134 [Smallanthus sonchifolius]KAI3675547.1 hypothetical protein L1987_85137 [Smallanthus sonchifolius]KAI3675558.1 hypothetical protein L1987_85148 [Smallanthus sonchifolius]